MQKKQTFLIFLAAIGVLTCSIQSEPSPNFKVFLCFGQSNMSGGSGCNPDAESKITHPRIKVLAFNNCNNPSRTKDTWSDAAEPMHCGDGIDAMGPSYAFGRALIDSLAETDTIGLIPCGQWGVSITYFEKGGSYSGSKPNYPGGSNVYQWMLERCKKAQERGVISGIMLHQGESDNNNATWPDKIKTLYENLKADLELTNDIPLVAGELLYSGCCSSHNTQVRKIPEKLPLGGFASADGLSGGGSQPQYHFNTDGYRELGNRFAIEMFKLLPTITKISSSRNRFVTEKSIQILDKNAAVYSLDGRLVSRNLQKDGSMRNAGIIPGNIYIIKNGIEDNTTRLILTPGR